jgi:hypothetical protein
MLSVAALKEGIVMTILKSILALVASAAVAACGGGGGGSPVPQIPPASAAAALTTGNFGSIAGPTAAAILASSVADNSLEIIAGSTSQANTSGLQSASPSQLALWAIRSARNGREQAQTVTSLNQACPAGGSLTGSFNDSDNNDDISAGDTLTINANSCVTTTGGLAINGGFTLRVNSITYNNIGDVTSASLSMSFNNFTGAGNTLNGAVTISVSAGSVTANYQNFSNARPGAATSTLNFTSVVTNSGSLTINGLITVNNNTYTLSTPTALTFGSRYPIGGVLRVVDAAGGRIDLVSTNVSGGYLDCDLYLPGDSVRDGRISSAWSAL